MFRMHHTISCNCLAFHHARVLASRFLGNLRCEFLAGMGTPAATSAVHVGLFSDVDAVRRACTIV